MFMNVSVILYTTSFYFYVKHYIIGYILYNNLNEVEKCNLLKYLYLFIRQIARNVINLSALIAITGFL